ncbi:MAG: hypothetical protein JSS43_21540 [Proteobacteria bacterium]|nr:hypothetical protein [Pseudomonadota bacterium]
MILMGSGTLTRAGVTFESLGGGSVSVSRPADGEFSIHARAGNYLYGKYSGKTAPGSFGTGGSTLASTHSGYILAFIANKLSIDPAYADGTPFVNSATFSNTDFQTLGVTPGSYVWRWATLTAGDSIVLNIVATVPEPATTLLLTAPVVALAAARRKRHAAGNRG